MSAKTPEAIIKVSTSMDDMLAGDAIRGARFLLADPYGVEFDGKDLAATTHLLARNPDTKDPLATMRIRFLYGTLVAWERLAVAANGPPRLLFSMVNAARRYSQAKGMTRVVGRVCDDRLQQFWTRQGATFPEQGSKLFGGKVYLTMHLPLTPAAPPPDEDIDVLEEEWYLRTR
ncbi:MAG TPA: hypothetical protein DD390_12055 [Rhodospirillaceae bacterium]|nr:hypothetical protein [Rhodospirillaceae bacterium]MAX61930.1 hypothetical protein [Rhodospirillaceae bacterium]MAX63266.1 hypothetical protein [Rhodospirillaceae bacterium]HBM13420.1 hypothetical protein [Rhodospirillaceae bacterium]|tara:strand:- start:285 stop:806 length:522 start_codon:yes stop_codon:yes gene_type:complete